MKHVSIDVSAVPLQPAGAGRYIVEVVSRLAQSQQLRLTLLSRRDDQPRWTSLAPGSNVQAVVPNKRPLRLVWEQTALPLLLSKLKPSVHFSPHYTMPELARVPRLVTIHDMTFFDHPEWHEQAKVQVFRRAISTAARNAEGLVAVSKNTANQLQERFGPVPVLAIPLGVDHETFTPNVGSDDLALLRQLGIKGRYVAFVGTIEPRKDVPTLLGAFDHLADVHADLQLVVAGGFGWGTEQVRKTMKFMRHADRVILTGYIADAVVPALLRHASVVAYPSLSEGFGLPALEALACAAPLVTTTGSAMEEVVEDAALLIAPGDVNALAAAIESLVNESSQSQRLRSRGPEVASVYTWDATAASHERQLLQHLYKRH